MSPIDVMVVSAAIGGLVVAATVAANRPKRVPVRVRHDDDEQR